ncbi:MAG: hypothetical protein MJ065_01770 [Oscillospiraceae bacterium]|nr:hypothetical protein [Oscillospiraceae bacterium]
MEGMQNVQTVYLAGDPRTAAKLLQRLLLMKPEKAYPFSGGYAFSLAFFRYLCYTDKEKNTHHSLLFWQRTIRKCGFAPRAGHGEQHEKRGISGAA